MKDKFDKKTWDLILHDRKHLTDFEKDQLIPELKSRLNVLRQYFNDIINICTIQKGSAVFTAQLETIINRNAINARIPSQSLADRFFDQTTNQVQTENIDDIDRILKEYENIEDLKKLGLFANEANFLCSSLLSEKNKLFLCKM